jgi:hypothetical protein
LLRTALGHTPVRSFTKSVDALSYALAEIMCVPDAKEAVEKLVPPLVVVIPSTVQSTLMTAGSTTFTVNIAGLFTAPAGGSVESIGVTARQMLKII